MRPRSEREAEELPARKPHGLPRARGYAGRCSPLTWVRCMIRRLFGSKASRRCMVQRLSHRTRSPTRQTCSQANSGRSTKPTARRAAPPIPRARARPDRRCGDGRDRACAGRCRDGCTRAGGRAPGESRIVGRRHALTHIAAAVVGAVVLDLQVGDAVLQLAGSAS